MIGTQEILDALKNIGLNLYERKIYLALLAKGVATAGEVSEIAKVPRSRSYDVLESLADKGFVVAQSSKPIKYVALAPQDALERAKDNISRKHTESLERMDRMVKSPIMGELEAVYKEGFRMVQPSDISGTLKGNYSINQQVKALLKGAGKSISIITTGEGLAELHSKHLNVLRSASKSGVKIKILSPGNSDPKATEALSKIAEVGAIESPMGRMFMVDGEHFMLSLTDPAEVHPTQDVAFWAGSKHVASDVLGSFFESIWASSKK